MDILRVKDNLPCVVRGEQVWGERNRGVSRKLERALEDEERKDYPVAGPGG